MDEGRPAGAARADAMQLADVGIDPVAASKLLKCGNRVENASCALGKRRNVKSRSIS